MPQRNAEVVSRIDRCDSRIPPRLETALWVTVFVVGVGLRCAKAARVAVEHFDEGVYVSNLWFAEEGYRYPDAHFYAPPFFPWLNEWVIALFGPTRWACMSVSLVAGSATILLMGWVARRWFGPEAGLTAATLTAFSDVHLLYSRTALTDPLLCFWLLLAVYWIGESYRRNSFPLAIAAGAATGLAWWTKYTGWLPLAIGLAGLVPASLCRWFLLRPGPRSEPRRRPQPPAGRAPPEADPFRPFVLWFVMAATALAVWYPGLAGLSDHGGYSVVAANHRKYIVGLAGWWPSLQQQWAGHEYLSGWLTIVGLALAGAGAATRFVLDRRFTWNGSPADGATVGEGAGADWAGMWTALTVGA
ncbi:MAG TPA: phospholipid carrier-dependent glycosyltransferase, partial [Planctomycetaceae bacterium]|nr:phospholipid carrier-dependent glycosyltransferase [Planctomycetaceae bacterium]